LKKKLRGNVEAGSYYDPFPKSGLVKQYEPFIRKEVGEFCKRWQTLSRDDVLSWAVEIAIGAEARFKPELGYDFSMFLRNHLKGLSRFAERETALHYVPLSAEEKRAIEEAEEREAAENRTPEGKFLGGANGARVTLDVQSMEGESADKRRRTVLRVQLASTMADHILPLWERASPDVKFIAERISDPAIRCAYLRALLDHQERRQDEINQEAENEQRGQFGSIFLEARPKRAALTLVTTRAVNHLVSSQTVCRLLVSMMLTSTMTDGWANYRTQ
jgi:hypothetical protein